MGFRFRRVVSAIAFAALVGGGLAATGEVSAGVEVCPGDELVFTDFSSTDHLELLGDAQVVSNVAQLTDGDQGVTGAMYTMERLDVDDGFRATFTYSMNPWNGAADGMAFVLHNATDSFIPEVSGGSGLGYAGLPNSIALELDTYEGTNDPSDNHLGLHTEGTAPNTADDIASSVVSYTPPSINLNDGQVHEIIVEYFPTADKGDGVLSVVLDGTEVIDHSGAQDLFDDLDLGPNGSAYLGFTAATGGDTQFHKVHSATLCSNGTIDSDGDNVPDVLDDFPADPNESVDTDDDGTGNNADTDDDADGFSDTEEADAGSDPLDADSVPQFQDLTPADSFALDHKCKRKNGKKVCYILNLQVKNIGTAALAPNSGAKINLYKTVLDQTNDVVWGTYTINNAITANGFLTPPAKIKVKKGAPPPSFIAVVDADDAVDEYLENNNERTFNLP